MDNNNNNITQKCARCKVSYDINLYEKRRNGVYLKTCNRCRECKKDYNANNNNNKCEHNKRPDRCKECNGSSICEHSKDRYQCKECNGSSFCEHSRQRSRCKECNGSSICEHSRQRSRCKECNGSSICEHSKERHRCKVCSDPIKITIRHWISSSKKSDKKNDRYDANIFIDECFLKGLVEETAENENKCHYYEKCGNTVQYIEFNDNLATIERLDNTIGHTKSNCVIACLMCNRKHQ